jgi:hypothetical protein
VKQQRHATKPPLVGLGYLEEGSLSASEYGRNLLEGFFFLCLFIPSFSPGFRLGQPQSGNCAATLTFQTQREERNPESLAKGRSGRACWN